MDLKDIIFDNGQYLLDNLSLNQGGSTINDISVNKVIKGITYQSDILGREFIIFDTFLRLIEDLNQTNYTENQSLFY